MLRLLGRKHTSAVLSVSINPLSGHIATLSALQLALFTINGEVLAEVNDIASDTLTAAAWTGQTGDQSCHKPPYNKPT